MTNLKDTTNSPQLTKMSSTKSFNTLVFAIMTWLGVGMLLPWNLFLNSYGFWMYRFSSNQTSWEDPSIESSQNFYQSFWTSFLGVAMMGVASIFIIINSALAGKFSSSLRIYFSLACILLCCIWLMVMTFIDTSSWYQIFFVIMLINATIQQGTGGILQGAIFEFSGAFPEIYFSGMLQGQAIAGVLTSVLAILPIMVMKKELIGSDGEIYEVVNQDQAATLYFAMAVGCIFFTIFAYWLLMRLSFTKEILKSDSSEKTVFSLSNWLSDCARLSKKLWMPYFSMWLNYAITLSVFPSVCQLIESGCDSDSSYCRNVGKNKELFTAIFTFVMYNSCDWLGRFLAGFVQIFKPHQQFLIMICVVLRLVPMVLLMFGNVYGNEKCSKKMVINFLKCRNFF